MKHSELLYGISIIAVVGILSSFVGYTLPTQIPTQSVIKEGTVHDKVTTPDQGTAATITTTRKKDSCGCCAQRQTHLNKQRQQARARKLNREQASKTEAP